MYAWPLISDLASGKSNAFLITSQSCPASLVAVLPSWHSLSRILYTESNVRPHCVFVRHLSKMWDLGRGRTGNNTGNEEGKGQCDLPGARMRETVRVRPRRNQSV